MYSIQEQLRGNHKSDTALPDNYFTNDMCSSSTRSNISEKSHGIWDRGLLNVFPIRIAGTSDSILNDCFDKEAMQNEVAPGIFIPETYSLGEIESHEADETKYLKNGGKGFRGI
ncbi:hypothetical protein NPIL_65281 [Nephila pilipes]|uniref:Uncharacterized protein n=1 Tax=Nephila pilipes TaxID=299642 RepID=A0A8X6PXZ9_NEPPI|nr:hypothetical protein NPIL_465291 [Nephila pilipes]GFT95528.1 hypothetical protein NPIL_65281 [Nephila pilipes]